MTGQQDLQPEDAGSPSRWYVWIAVAVLGFYLWTEHRAHLYGVLPYLFVLLCPLMHLFMHRGGHRHDDRGHDGGRT